MTNGHALNVMATDERTSQDKAHQPNQRPSVRRPVVRRDDKKADAVDTEKRDAED